MATVATEEAEPMEALLDELLSAEEPPKALVDLCIDYEGWKERAGGKLATAAEVIAVDVEMLPTIAAAVADDHNAYNADETISAAVSALLDRFLALGDLARSDLDYWRPVRQAVNRFLVSRDAVAIDEAWQEALLKASRFLVRQRARRARG